MSIEFKKLIGRSWDRTKLICFKPFNLKKWAWFTIIALLAGQLVGGCSLNLGTGDFGGQTQEAVQGSAGQQEAEQPAEKPQAGPGQKAFSPLAAVLIGFLILVLIGLCVYLFILLWMILARFAFVFIGAVVKNDASIKAPFKEYKKEGNSLFLWYVALNIIGAVVMVAIIGGGFFVLIKAGVFKEPGPGIFKAIILAMPWVILFIGYLVVIAIVSFFTIDFIEPMMYKARIKVMDAWKRFFPILKENKAGIFSYMLIKFGLFILASLAVTAVSAVVLIALLIPGAIIALILALAGMVVYKIAGPVSLPFLVIIGVIIGVPAVICIIFLLYMVTLPAAVFFRIFSLEFLAAISKEHEVLPQA